MKNCLRIKTEKALVAKKVGITSGRIVLTQPSFVYRLNCGMIRVKLGIIIVESNMVNHIFFSLQRNLENPYATRLQLISVPNIFSATIIILFFMYISIGLMENTSVNDRSVNGCGINVGG